jgi:branched-subunit amino acid ABC-type transport system permease component
VVDLKLGELSVLPDLAGMTVYLLMAVVLLWRPEGIFGKRLR